MTAARVEHPLPRWAARRPVTVLMAVLTIAVIGAAALYRIPLEFAPEMNHPWMWCNVLYPNSNPEENDRAIAEEWEEQLKRVRFLKRLEITSTSNEVSASLQFHENADMDVAYLDVRDACDRARAVFPSNVGTLNIYHNRSSSWPIIWMGVARPGNIDELNRLIQDRIKPALERIDGVGMAEVLGLNRKIVQIDMDLGRIRSHGVAIRDIYSDLAQAGRNLSLGTVRVNGQKWMVRGLGGVEDIDDYSALPLRGGMLTVDDVAQVGYRAPEMTEKCRIDGHEGWSLAIRKSAQANTVEVGDRVRRVIEDLRHDPELAGVTMTDFFNQADWIRQSLRDLRNSGIWGACFAAGVLMFFMRRLGITLVILTVVPISILASVIALYFLGFTLNIGSMLGMMLAVGMLVDNSIVVAENIHRLQAQGMARSEAGVAGAASVGAAITASTFTTIVVFLPLVFAKGEMGNWMKQVGIPIAVSLFTSLMAALTLIPLATQRIVKAAAPGETGLIGRVTERYVRALSWILNNRLSAFIVVLLVASTVLFAYARTDKNFNSGGGERQLFIRVQYPDSYSLEDASEASDEWETILLAHRDELEIKTLTAGFDKKSGHIRLFLKTEGGGLKTDNEIKERIREMLPERAGVKWWFGWQGGDQANARQVEITLAGNSSERLLEIAESLRPVLMAAPGVTHVVTHESDPLDEAHVTIRRDRALANGISTEEASRAVSIGVMGAPLPRLQRADGEVDVRLQLQPRDRESLHQLKNLILYNREGQAVPLNSIADFEMVRGSSTVVRVDGKIQHTIQIETEREGMEDVREALTRAMDSVHLPIGYSWSLGRSFEAFDTGMAEFGLVFLLAVVLVILLLGALFESLLHPVTIIISLPFALVGVYWTLYLTHTPQDVMGNIGLVLLIGIVVNNAIVLVDHVNQLRAGGMGRIEALVTAGRNRFRPIVMTASTTLLGLAPMANAAGSASGKMYASLAITVMGGLFSSTILTLLVLPLIYLLMDDLQAAIRRIAEG